MAGYPSNLAKTFSPTEQFPQHILPLLPLYNAQWWGYESRTAIVLVGFGPNFTGMIPGWSPTKVVQMVLIGCISRSRGQKIRFQNATFKTLV